MNHLLTICWDGKPNIGSTATGLSNCFRESFAFRSVSWQPRNRCSGPGPGIAHLSSSSALPARPVGAMSGCQNVPSERLTAVAASRRRDTVRTFLGVHFAIQAPWLLHRSPRRPASDGAQPRESRRLSEAGWGPGWHVVCWNCDGHLSVWLDCCRRALSIDVSRLSGRYERHVGRRGRRLERFNWCCAPPLPTTPWSAFTPIRASSGGGVG